ncbi:hypothetical protein [Thermosynechococcus sp. FA-CM-4201]
MRTNKKEGFAARRVTITRPDGKEIHHMVWIDQGMETKVQPIVDQILGQCPELQMRQALITQLIEAVFSNLENGRDFANCNAERLFNIRVTFYGYSIQSA